MRTARTALSLAAATCVLLCAAPAWAGATATKKGGNWLDTDTWTQGIPGGFDFATISGGDSISVETPGAGAYVLYNNGLLTLRAQPAPSLMTGSLGVGLQMNIGHASAGQLLVSGGATVGSVDTRVGALAGVSGFVSIDGEPNLKGDRASWFNSGELVIGASGLGVANGRVKLFNGGTINSANVSIGSGESIGVAEIHNGRLSVGNLLRVGDGGPEGEMILGGGSIVSSRSGVIGYGSGSTATLTDSVGRASMTGSSWINSGDFTVGAYARAVLNAFNGSVLSNQIGTIGMAASSVASATLNDSIWTNTGTLFVGLNGNGALRAENGAQVSSASGVIGRYGSATGSVVVDGARWVNAGELVVGHGVTGLPGSQAKGFLAVRNGGRVDNTTAVIGYGAGASGNVEVRGVDAGGGASTWASSAELMVGRGGSGVLTIADGGRVSSPLVYLGYDAAGGGSGQIMLDGYSAHRGVLETGQVVGGTGAGPVGGVLLFDGGVLRASAHQPQLTRNLGPSTVRAGGAFIDSQAFNVGIASGFTGVGGLTKLGSGTLDLRGVSSLGAWSAVDGGTLLLNGTLHGDIEVRAGARLGGSGQVNGAVVVLPGGVLSPGNSPGTLHLGALDLRPDATLLIELGALSDRLVIDGDVVLAGVIDFVGDAAFFNAGALPDFLHYGGALSGSGLTIGALPAGVDRSRFALDFGTPGTVALSAIPEPASIMLWLCGLGGLAALGRRRRAGACA